MGSDEERLEEMLKAVMETENIETSVGLEGDIPDISSDGLSGAEEADAILGFETDILPEQETEGLPEMGTDDIPEFEADILPEQEIEGLPEMGTDDIPEFEADILPEQEIEGLPEMGTDDIPEFEEDAMPEYGPDVQSEMLVDPLTLLDMSEEEIDRVLSGEGTAGVEKFPEKKAAENNVSGNMNLDADSGIRDILGGTEGLEEALIPEKPEGIKKKREKKEKKEKKARKPKAEGKKKKEGFGKKLAALFFGSDEDELEDAELKVDGDAIAEKELIPERPASAKAAKKDKKKKEKKKPPKKKESNPQKAAKEKLKREKNAEKAKIRAAKAERAEKERRAAKKLPKKKVFVWVLFCASIGAGILLLNSIGIATLQLTEARNAFYDKDFKTAYRLLNGRELKEEDALLFKQSSAVLHLEHAKAAYENHLKLNRPVVALEDLLKGVDKYQKLLQIGEESLIMPELTAQYQDILKILQEKYGLSEEGALEINAIEEDYAFSMQLEALAGGEIYQSRSEIAQQEEEEAVQAFPELEDLLPEEEEFLNDGNN